jgi:hypothetical protein
VRAQLTLLTGQTTSLGLFCALLLVPSSSLFLVEYGATRLPYVYIAVGVAGVLASWGMSRAQRRWTLLQIGLTVLASLLVVVAAGWVLLVAAEATWVTFPLLVLFPLSIPIGLFLVGAQAGRLLDLQQMKAKFSRVVGGFTIGLAVGGLLAAWLVHVTGDIRQLLLLDLVPLAAFAVLLAQTGRRYPAQLHAVPAPIAVTPAASQTLGRGRVTRLVLLVLGYSVASAAATQLLYFIVWDQAAARYPDATHLAAFLGAFGAIMNTVSIAFVVLLAGRLLRRFGVRLGLVANPVAVLAVTTVSIVTGAVAGSATTVFFVLVCSAQVADIALTDGTTRTSINATYQALAPAERLAAQTSVEAAGEPAAIAAVGGLVLIFGALGLGIIWLAVAAAVLGVLWLAIAALCHREYGRRLRDSLARRDWDPTALLVTDAASRAAVERLLSSADPRDVQLGVDVLTSADPTALGRHIGRLLTHPDAEHRRIGVQAAGAAADPATGPATVLELVQIMRDEAQPADLRVSAAHAIAALGSDLSALAVVLDDAHPELRLTAAMLLTRRDGPLADRGRAVCHAALESTDAVVVAAALSAVTQGPDASYVAGLMTLAARRAGSRSAVGAAVAAHVGLPGCDAAALQRLAVTEEQTATRGVQDLGLRRDGASLGVLTELLSGPDRRLARAAGPAIAARGHALEPDLAERLVAAESSRAARAAAAAEAVTVTGTGTGTGRAEHLRRALDDEIRACARQARCLVGAAFGNQWLARTVAQLASSADGDRALAVETLELELGRRTAAHLLELVDPDVDDDGRRALLAAAAPSSDRAAGPWLNELLDDPHTYWQDDWLRACALYAASELAPESAAAAALTWQDAADPVLAETAQWLRGELGRTIQANRHGE